MISRNIFNKHDHNDFVIRADELPLLIDQIPFPCVILDSGSTTILAINDLFTEMTNYGNHELIGGEFSSLIEQNTFDEIIEGNAYKCRLKVKRKPEIPILFKLQHISKNRNLALIKITKSENGGKIQFNINKKIIDALEQITKISFLGDRNCFFQTVLDKLCEIFSCSKSFLYLIDSQQTRLEKFKKDDHHFPISLPVSELKRIKNIDYWSPGKRVLTEIHRIGRREGYASIVTIPIGDEVKGLLIIVSEDETIYTQYQEELESFTNWITHFIDYLNMIDKNQLERRRLLINNHTYSKLFEHSNDCLILINNQRQIIKINEHFSNLMKYSSYELIGQDILGILQNGKIIDLLGKKDKKSVEIIRSLVIHNREGKSITIEMKVVESIWEKEKSDLIILSDLSSDIKTRQSIEKIKDQAALGEMISYFAHDVRNPINDISTGLQLMRRRINKEDPNLQVVDRMQSDCIRMNDLMESILSFSRQDIADFKPFDCCALLERIIRRFQNKFQKEKIQSRIDCKAQDTLVIGDIRSMDQVFTNLINNATDAMTNMGGGELSIQIDKKMDSTNFLEIKISDTGHGIPEDFKEKIFEPLVSGKETGTGLGLAITRRIIDAHGGRIEVVSYANGTIFMVELRLSIEENK